MDEASAGLSQLEAMIASCLRAILDAGLAPALLRGVGELREDFGRKFSEVEIGGVRSQGQCGYVEKAP